MREIKFRGKTLQNKWVFGAYVQALDDDSCDFIIDTDANHHIVKMDTVGQSTGLKDKNGTDIYEGDILQMWLEDSVESAGGLLHQMYVIFTPEKGFTLWGKRMTMEDAEPMHEMLKWKDCEITGNVHDNPELLKTE